VDIKMKSEENTQWFGFYSKLMAILGVFMLSVGIATPVSLVLSGGLGKNPPFTYTTLFFAVTRLAVLGLLVMALADLLGYVAGLLPNAAGTKSRKGWLMRHAYIGLYLLGTLGLLERIPHLWQISQLNTAPKSWLIILVGGAGTVVKAAVLVALGLFVRRVLPIIEESRTLV